MLSNVCLWLHTGYGKPMRIGELSTRTGVSAATLRVWESRYGLLQPSRTVSGYRQYGPDDERRVSEMIRLRGAGVSARDASARVLARERLSGGSTASRPERVDPGEVISRLLTATATFDDRAGAAALDDTFSGLSLERAVTEVLMPFLVEVGERWECGSLTVAHEHFASGLVRGRLTSFSYGWGVGAGPVAVLACPPGEHHDIALLAFGVLLGKAGWRIRYLGADTPVTDLTRACDIVAPDLVIVAATRETALTANRRPLALLARVHNLALAGQGGTADLARAVGAHLLTADPVAAVDEAARLVRTPDLIGAS